MINPAHLDAPWTLAGLGHRGRYKTPTAYLQDDVGLVFGHIMGATDGIAEYRGETVVRLVNAKDKVEAAMAAVVKALDADPTLAERLDAQVPGTAQALRDAKAALNRPAKRRPASAPPIV